MADLPQTKVKVDVKKSPDGNTDGCDITLTRAGTGRATVDGKPTDTVKTFTGEGKSVGEAVQGAVEKMVSDRATGEFL